MQHFNWSITEMDNLMPWEREIYLTMLIEFLKEEEERHKNAMR